MDKSNNSTTDAAPSEGILTNMSTIERRRFLFKSVGKGAAVGAVMVSPMRSIASSGGDTVLVCKHPTSAQMIMCSVSGMQSAIGSRDLNTEEAKGFSPGYWGKLDGNSCVKVGGTDSNPVWGPKMERKFPPSLSNWSWTTLVKTVLTQSSLGTGVTLGMLMAVGDGKCEIPSKGKDEEVDYGKYSNTTDAHWICAILNAATFPTRFPYSATKIRDVANGTDTSIDRDMLYKLVVSLEGVNERN